MKWLNFLHLYQPANTNSFHIQEATEKAYKRIVRGLENNPKIKFTLNISGCLLLRWEDTGFTDLYARINKLINRGQIELVGSGAYHPLLPLLPKEEIIWQIKENEKLIKQFLGSDIKLRGFFLPEMAYDLPVAKIIKKLGYEWLILDEFAFRGKEKNNQIDYAAKYIDPAGLNIIFRQRNISGAYAPDILPKFSQSAEVLVTATDAEIYGLRHEDPTAEFEKLLKRHDLETQTISEYFETLKQTKKIKLIPSSWDSTTDEIKRGQPFALWHNNRNRIHQLLWQLADLALGYEKQFRRDKNNYWSRWHLVRGLASCTFWWASRKDFRYVFGPIAWNPDEISKGTNELIRVIRSISLLPAVKKIEAEKLYHRLQLLIWETHWKK